MQRHLVLRQRGRSRCVSAPHPSSSSPGRCSPAIVGRREHRQLRHRPAGAPPDAVGAVPTTPGSWSGTCGARLLSAVLIGAGLAISGLIFQSVTRNPLAAPDILGIDSGAAFAAVAVIMAGDAMGLVPGRLIGGARRLP